jgi:polysaccharide export outer membrane protein
MFPARNLLCLFVFLALAACSGAAPVTTDLSGTPALASYASAPPARDSGGPYLLGPGDRLRIKAYSDEQLNGEYEVNSSGYVSIPLAGEIKAAGLTTRKLERAIVARMKGKIARDPKITVEIATYAPFYIYGEVKKAGEYPFRPGLTVADAVATAGGLTYRANESKIYLRRADKPTEQVVTLDRPVRVFPGDNIRVSERMF